jgi:predicted ABC-class ATPase
MNPAWKEYRALLRLRMLFTQFEDDDVFSSLLSEKGFDAGHSIRCHVNDLSELMTGLVQNQSQLWPDQDLQQLPELTVSLKCTADMVMNKLWRNLMDDLKQACNALEQVVSDIGKLQRNEISEFRPAANLFRELNGLGTFYLVGVLER